MIASSQGGSRGTPALFCNIRLADGEIRDDPLLSYHNLIQGGKTLWQIVITVFVRIDSLLDRRNDRSVAIQYGFNQGPQMLRGLRMRTDVA